MITADQLVAHAVGDYVIQSEWMANNKDKKTIAAAVHAVTYSLPFLLLTRSAPALLVILVTHFVIDRWALAKYVVWIKNRPWPGSRPWTECRATGFPVETPPWLATWLVIIVDNTMHIVINGAAILYLG